MMRGAGPDEAWMGINRLEEKRENGCRNNAAKLQELMIMMRDEGREARKGCGRRKGVSECDSVAASGCGVR
jgi:hypothetical protein